MNRIRSYYDLFGVAPDATDREIRAAYLRLMKRHHPDAGNGEEPHAADIVATANRCYAVLKDPARRAAYDAQLARPAGRQLAASGRALARRERRASLVTGLLLVGSLGVVGGAAALMTASGPSGGGQGVAARILPNTESLPPVPSAEQVRQQVRSAIAVTGERAVQLSQICYATARATRSEADAQACVIFDEAALYSPGVWGLDPSESDYFNAEIVRVRQSGSLAPFERDPQQRLDVLRRAAFVQVVTEIQAENAAKDAAAAAIQPVAVPPPESANVPN